MRVLFLGTPDFACPTLRALKEAKCFDIIGVFTQEDRRKGRGQAIQAPPVKRLAQSFNIPVFQPQRLDESNIGGLWYKLSPDVAVVVAYGHILPSWILHCPRLGCINLHASLLPQYRGPAPINWAIMNGEKQTGITTILMDEGIDTGPILMQTKTQIEPKDTAGSLHDRLSVLGAELMIKTIKGYAQGRISPRTQPETGLSLAPKLDKEIGRLDWNKENYPLWNLIRGINPLPGAFTFLNTQMIKIWDSHPVTEDEVNVKPGQICGFDPDLGLIVQTGKGRLGLQEIQPQSKKRMSAQAFINGCRFNPIGQILKRFPNQIF